MYRYRRPWAKDLFFFLMMCLGWLIWWITLRSDFMPEDLLGRSFIAYMTWSALCAGVTVSLLYWIDYFRPFRIHRFFPDFLAVCFTLPISGLLMKPVVALLFEAEFIRTREIFFGAFVPALCAVIWDGLSTWAKAKRSDKKTVYLALLPGETERFKESISIGGWEKYYRILTQEEFNGALATGGRVDYIVISRVATKNFLQHQNILQAQMLGVTILDYRTLLNQLRGCISLHDIDIWTFLAGAVRQNALQMAYRGLKFYLEPLAAAFLLLMLSPVFIGVSILIKVASPGPILFRQRRTGYLGVDFDLLKFRSMRSDAEAGGAQWASKTDTRVTPVGKFLRKTRLDELPQLWNVVCGEMSFMGPRPERPEFYEVIGKQVPAFKLRLLVRPGITGWAQLLGGYAASIEESERKLEYDLYYMQYLSPQMDLVIFWRTILTLLKGDSGQ